MSVSQLVIQLSSSVNLVVTGVVILIMSAYVLWLRQPAQKGYPAGPYSLPMLGNLLQVALHGSIASFMSYYRKQYGDVSSLHFPQIKRSKLL